MLDFSFGELALIMLVALVVVGPKDLPVVMRALGRWIGQCKGIADEFRAGFKSALEGSPLQGMEQDLRAINEEVRFIHDEQGNLQRVYDVTDLPVRRNLELEPPSTDKKI
jgi:sec-independent protein translocase protein TatB